MPGCRATSRAVFTPPGEELIGQVAVCQCPRELQRADNQSEVDAVVSGDTDETPASDDQQAPGGAPSEATPLQHP
jgi:hypothetical protein